MFSFIVAFSLSVSEYYYLKASLGTQAIVNEKLVTLPVYIEKVRIITIEYL